MRIVTSTEQRSIELAASAGGMSVFEMVHNAGRGVFEYLKKDTDLNGCQVAVLCGRGGNAADGFFVAELLMDAGAKPVIILCGGVPTAEAPLEFYSRAIGRAIPVMNLETEQDRCTGIALKAELVIDAVFGIGFSGELPPRIALLFEAVNRGGAQVISIDVPSGANADTGEAAEHALVAKKTLYVVAAKAVHVLKSAAAYCGEAVYVDIGIPEGPYEAVEVRTRVISAALAAQLLPARSQTGHKYDFGSLVCFVGSERYRGAAVLCAKGALVSGVGLIHIASGGKVLDAVAAHCPEPILIDAVGDRQYLGRALIKAKAVVAGCGLQEEPNTEKLVEQLLTECDYPVLLDAAGIKAVSDNIDIVRHRKSPTILTPHIGEFSRLTGGESAEVYRDRIRLASAFARENGVVLVLKSDNTVVALPNGDAYVNTAGNSGLAKGGSGDVLAGMIGSLCAAGLSAQKAALLGVYLHALAADIAARDMPQHAITPSIVADSVAAAIGEVAKAK